MATPTGKGKLLLVRLLGELSLSADGLPLPLPASKKSRALLGYLVATGTPHLRERLCELLWDVPDDPRAALRWSLSKIRPLLDHGGVKRLVADRERAGFARSAVEVDLDVVESELAKGPESVPIEVLRKAALSFRGEFLEGLELPACYRYHAWCVGQRESARRLRIAILSALADRLASDPEQAIHFARARVAVDPFSEPAHIALIRLLGRAGRGRDAAQQYETCRRILDTELRTKPSAELELLRMNLDGLRAEPPPRPPEELRRGRGRVGVRTSALVGRQRERDILEKIVTDAAQGAAQKLLVIVGDAGIGKTRLLEELSLMVRGRGGKVLLGRAFEAEMVRPYGAWIDALRSLPLAELPSATLADLAPLLPELGNPETPSDRNRLFYGVLALLSKLSTGDAPTLVVLDDLHWLDEASAALLHFVARAGAGVICACAARAGELSDNKAALRLVRSLAREQCVREMSLGPLDRQAIADLLGSISADIDADRVFAESEGSPLFALEIARALENGGSPSSATLDGLIGGRLDQLEGRAAELLPWAASLGRSFRTDLLIQTTAMPTGELLAAVEELERRGILRSAASVDGAAGYDFVHDLVRQVAYRRISEPRRRFVHVQIARALSSMADPSAVMAGDLAHHAALGGEDELAVRACVAAGDRCLRLFANGEAAELADRGWARVHKLAREKRLPLQIGLLRIRVVSGAWRTRAKELETEISRVVLDAQAAGMHSEVAMGLYVISELHWFRGDFAGARETTLRSAEAARAADPATTARALGNTGRCLAMLEQHMARAWALLQEATDLSARVGLELPGIPLGLGILHHHIGNDDMAVRLLVEGQEMSATLSDHWFEWDCVARLAMLELERDRPAEALRHCERLAFLAGKMPEGSELAVTEALEALAQSRLGAGGSEPRVEKAIANLRAIDTKAYLAYALTSVAELDLRRGDIISAGRRADEALEAAEAVGRRSEVARARAMRARVRLLSGDRKGAKAEIEAMGGDIEVPLGIAASARASLAAVARELGMSIEKTEESWRISS